MRIIFTAPSLRGGGAERVVVRVSGALAARGHEVHIITLSGISDDAYEIDPAIIRVGLDIEKTSQNILDAIRNNWSRLRTLRKAIRASKPDIVVAFTTTTAIQTRLTYWDCPVVACEQTNPRHHHLSRQWQGLRRISYPFLAHLVSPSYGVDEAFSWVSKKRRTTIYSPVQVLPASGSSPLNENRKHIVALGRLEPVKGFDVLISAFAEIAQACPNWDLNIFGEGSQRESLEKQVNTLNLTDRVFLPGRTNAPFDVYHAADIFVLSSHYEGMPNVLLEALASGMACVSFDCESGPAELIEHEVNGLLVPSQDVDGLAKAISRLMDDKALRQRLGKAAIVSAERFSLEDIANDWERLLTEIIADE